MADAKPKPRNEALRMLGLPVLPKKLPSRNWLIFWTLSTSLAAAIIYDGREKKRATARWAAAVAPLARQPLHDPSAMPRRVTVYLEAPPGDGLRSAQDHFAEYVKPVLARSGLDWEFVVGRQQGDIRAVVAERVRRARRAVERDLHGSDSRIEADAPTASERKDEVRRKNGVPDYDGIKGDIVVGRHTWKEYVRGLHEGWLGPLTAPPPEAVAPAPSAADEKPNADGETDKDDKKPERPPQLPPYNTPAQYPSSALSRFAPAELDPSAPVPFPHLLGFLNTPIRLHRFLHRRAVADEIGRDVAAVCFGTHRAFREDSSGAAIAYEQADVLAHEEKDWVKTVWKEDTPEDKADKAADAAAAASPVAAPPTERIWASPIVLDPRIASRMHRFALSPADEAQARAYVVPEEDVEGWTKGKFRQLGRWAARKWTGEPPKVRIGNLDSDD